MPEITLGYSSSIKKIEVGGRLRIASDTDGCDQVCASPSGSLFALTFDGYVNELIPGDTVWHRHPGITGGPYAPLFRLAIGDTKTIVAQNLEDSVFRSTNSGKTWVPVASFPQQYGNILSIHASGSTFILTTAYNGVKVSTDDGATWKPFGEGLLPQCNDFTFTRDGSNRIFFFGDSSIYMTSDFGRSFTRMNLPIADKIESLIELNPGRILAGSTTYGLFASSDLYHWSESSQGLSIESISSACFTKHGTLLAACGKEGLRRSDDTGKTWRAINLGRGIYGISLIFEVGTDTILANDTYYGYLGRSTDQGETWSWSSFLPQYTYLYHPLFFNQDRTQLLAFTEYLSFRSTDRGVSWSQFVIDTTDGYTILSDVRVFQNGDVLAGTNHGTYRSTDGCQTWEHVDSSSALTSAIYF